MANEVQRHFKQLGWTAADPVYTLFGAIERTDALVDLETAIGEYGNVKLVIIDPLFRFVGGVRDSNDCVQVTNAVEPLNKLGRSFSEHIAVAHHAKKRNCEDVRDTVLGSQALAGAVDTLVYLKSGSAGSRLICTTQRYGQPMPDRQLTWDAETCSVCLGETMDGIREVSAQNVRERIENEMLAFACDNSDSLHGEIIGAAHGNGTTKYEVFKSMVESGLLERTGKGVKSSPFRYSAPHTVESTASAA